MTLLEQKHPSVTTDPHWPALAALLDRIDSAGGDVHDLLDQVLRDRALPADNPARSLDYRLSDAAPRPHPRHRPSPALQPATRPPPPPPQYDPAPRPNPAAMRNHGTTAPRGKMSPLPVTNWPKNLPSPGEPTSAHREWTCTPSTFQPPHASSRRT